MKVIVQRLEDTGVNLDVVYSLDVMDQGLNRMEAIATVLTTPRGPARNQEIRRLVGLVIHDRLNDRSLLQLIRTNLRLLATRIIDHASRTGEHYIAVSRREYWGMWKAAAGGGLLTAGTAAIKLVVDSCRPASLCGRLSGWVELRGKLRPDSEFPFRVGHQATFDDSGHVCRHHPQQSW